MPEVSAPLYVHGMGHFHPEAQIDNAFLESLEIGTTDTWIRERVGILCRRTVLPLSYLRETKNQDVRQGYLAALHDNADTGARAARMALARAGLNPSDIGLVIAGGCSPDQAIPADACRIAEKLGIEAPAFDLNSACSSFGAQLHFLSSLERMPEFALVVNAENTTRVVDYSDRASAVLWGDGSSASVVSRRAVARLRVVSSSLASCPAEYRAVMIPRFGHFTQHGQAVQHFAIRTSVTCLRQLLSSARAERETQGGRIRFIGHQANLLMLQAVAQRAGVQEAEHWHNVTEFGNTGAAGAPSVLSHEELRAGDSVLIVVVGAGLTWASLRLDVEA